MSSLLFKALKFAEKAHAGQMRKYGNRPYIFHPIEVMTKVISWSYDEFGICIDDDVICAALLHDTIEDCEVTQQDLEKEFTSEIALLVMELSQPDKLSEEIHKLPRKERHQLLLQKLKNVSYKAKLIKLADRLCNLLDSDISNPECYGFFKKRYLQESWDIYNILSKENFPRYIINELKEVIEQLAKQIGVKLI